MPSVSARYQVQRSVHIPPTVDGTTPRGPEAGRRKPPAVYVDAGEIAVNRGLAHRDHDGSVVFNFSPSASGSAPAPRLSAHAGESGVWHAVASAPDTVQRQAANSAAREVEPSPDLTSASASPVSSAAPSSSSAPATSLGGASAPAAAGMPLEELARQLFGPLSARLKAELRLDRERAGLLTDLRQ
jgi:hypothetical protein